VNAALAGRKPKSLAARVGATVAGVLSVACGLLVLPALYGFAAHWDRMRNPPNLTQTSYRLPPLDPMDALRFALLWALAGLVLGAIAMALSPSGAGSKLGRPGVALSVVFAGFALLLGPMLGPHKTADKAVCLSNMKNLVLAIQLYAEDSGGALPSADAWCDTLDGYTKNRGVFLCERSWGTPSAYAYNRALDRATLARLSDPASLVAIFESNAGWNAHGGAELLVKEPRHLGGDNWGFADGHVQWLPRRKLPDGSWAKEPDADWVRWKP